MFNGMVDQFSLFTSEVTRVAREVGTDGRLGGQAEVPGVSGTWKDLTDSVNAMAGNLTSQVRDIAQVATAVAAGMIDAAGPIPGDWQRRPPGYTVPLEARPSAARGCDGSGGRW